MDAVTSLPPELWLLIFQLLPIDDIKRMMLVHSVFHGYSQPFLWQTLTLCTLSKRHISKAEAIIRSDPIRALHVKHLRLIPSNYESETPNVGDPDTTPTNLWVCQGWRHALENTTQLFPSFDHLRISWASQRTAGQVAPLLNEIQKLTVVTWFFEDVTPPIKPYLALWKALFPGLSQLRVLDLTFKSSTAISLFSAVFRGALFHRLETINLDLIVGPRHPEWDNRFEETIRAIVDMGRSSLRSLTVATSSALTWGYEFSYASLFSAFGVLPHLLHFDFSYLGDGWEVRDNGFITQFLDNHRSTLSRVGLFIPAPNHLPLLEPTYEFHPGDTLKGKLVSLHLVSNIGDPFTPTGLRPYAETLTTLVLETMWNNPSCGFCYPEVLKLISSLDVPSHGVLLRKLQIPIVNLSPEIFDLVSSNLDNLDTLGLAYHFLVGDKDCRDEDEPAFRGEMGHRSFRDWGLQHVYARRLKMKLPGDEERDSQLSQFIASRIPSVRRVGPIDWSDVAIRNDYSL
ncbi:hypothetical protein BDN72DRAFT_904370 [Pluteus cervinus]|uniref:Uncharacterized protein n=1 Tax=Pluteus cervinus TaxID=181527 RepID=A0ACD3A6X0_9AGAR|nr:hypothetical protein BDN72DRAFT_904370 [Pluteus cervinus]